MSGYNIHDTSQDIQNVIEYVILRAEEQGMERTQKKSE